MLPYNAKWLHDPDIENTLNKAMDWQKKIPRQIRIFMI